MSRVSNHTQSDSRQTVKAGLLWTYGDRGWRSSLDGYNLRVFPMTNDEIRVGTPWGWEVSQGNQVVQVMREGNMVASIVAMSDVVRWVKGRGSR